MALFIYIDYTDSTQTEFYVRFDDPVINKECRFTEYTVEAVNNGIAKVMKRFKVKDYYLFDTTGHFVSQ